MNELQRSIAEAYILLEGCNHSARVIALKLHDIGIEITADEVAGICARCGVSTKEPPKFKALKEFGESIADKADAHREKPRKSGQKRPKAMFGNEMPRPNSRAVVNDLGERYESIRMANLSAGYSPASGAICSAIRRGKPDKNGRTWRYAEGA